MSVYTIVSGTNRPSSHTRKFAELYRQMLVESGAEVQFFHLEHLPQEVFQCDVYEKVKQPAVKAIQDLFHRTDKFIFIFPEYNGSFPGMLKLVIDVLDPKFAFHGKKAGLIGISTGRAGNLRGLDQFAGVMNHLDIAVMPYLLPVSRVQVEMADGQLSEATLKVVRLHLQRMIAF